MGLPYDAVLLVSFGGPERAADVLPFLENVLRGKRVPRARMLEVAEHYYLFDGVSPINAQLRALLAALIADLDAHGVHLPVYWGNRNWHPMLEDTIRQMAEDGIRRALAFVTSAFASYSGCRQYLEDIQAARTAIGSAAPVVEKLRLFFNHPGFIEPMAERVAEAFESIAPGDRPATRLLFTAHSLPLAMADRCGYVEQLREACRLVAERAGRGAWDLVYQSRSGPAEQAWLEPDIRDRLAALRGDAGCRHVVVAPIGFLAEHMEVIYDLDVEVAGLCQDLDMTMVRAAVVGCHPRFVAMIRELLQERLDDRPVRLALGNLGPSPDVCPAGCCPPR
ncbi:MAG: ferrochelatase [Pirellulaceae bacterium]|jgi:ferrochelatase|nr:ferrochelatase [Thermoguttaceae bacterium]MDI9446778.1 ferrochelatase [Planctomycetota bacterium]NLZ01952.1 ferrochelatase [Pirellulaceae bacterium]